MATFLLDTNAVSDLAAGRSRMGVRFNAARATDTIATSVIVVGELLHGLARMPAGRRQRDLQQRVSGSLNQITCYPVPETAAPHYAVMKRARMAVGRPLDEKRPLDRRNRHCAAVHAGHSRSGFRRNAWPDGRRLDHLNSPRLAHDDQVVKPAQVIVPLFGRLAVVAHFQGLVVSRDGDHVHRHKTGVAHPREKLEADGVKL